MLIKRQKEAVLKAGTTFCLTTFSIVSLSAPISLECPGTSGFKESNTHSFVTVDVAKGSVHGRWDDGHEYDSEANVTDGAIKWYWPGHRGDFIGARLNRYDLSFYLLWDDDDGKEFKTTNLGQCEKTTPEDKAL